MAQVEWLLKLKEKLKANPLFHVPNGVMCKNCGGSGRKVALYQVTNYGKEFSVCMKCNTRYQ